MAQGVGIRYNSNGVRILKVEKANDGLKVTDIAAGLPGESFDSFIADHDFSLEDASVAFGLGPGDFLSSCIKREDGMDDTEIKDQLRWEIEREIISDPSEYNFDFAITGNTGFAFAGRKKLINEIISTTGKVLTDVEPVALFNGCESTGELGDGITMLTSVEAEGISSIVVEKGLPAAIESFLIKETEISSVMSGLDQVGISKIDNPTVERLAGHVFESINRLTSFGENKKRTTPDKLVLAGSGVYTGKLVDMVKDRYGITTAISDPYASLINDVKDINSELAGMGAAFTSCFGLALRAMEV